MGKISEHDLESAMAMESNQNLLSSGVTPFEGKKNGGKVELNSKFKQKLYEENDLAVEDLELKTPRNDVLTSQWANYEVGEEESKEQML